MKSLKIKFNAAEVIMNMPKKELKKYTITLEKKIDGPQPPTVIDLYNFMKEFKEYVIHRFDEVDKVLEEHGKLLEKHGKLLEKHEKLLEEYGKLFKEHGWIK